MNKQNILLSSLVCFTLAASPAVYAQDDMPALEETATSTSAIPMLSGGVGDDEMAQLKSVENQYNLKLLFTAPTGEYLSDVNVSIVDKQNHSIVDTVASGPVFLATLPPGKYKLHATSDTGVESSSTITVAGKTLRTYQIRLVAKE